MLDAQIPPDIDEELEEEEGGSSVTRFVPWLIIVALAMLFVPLYLGSTAIQDSIAPYATEMVDLGATLTAPPIVPVAEQTLSAQLLNLRSQYNVLQGIPPTMAAVHLDWPAIMQTLERYDANQIRLTGFATDNNRITVNGEAIQESSVLEYVSNLQKSGYFTQVRVQAITFSATPSPAPNLNVTPNPDAPLSTVYMPFVYSLSIDLARAS